MVFLEAYFHRVHSSLYTLNLTTSISRVPHKVVPRQRGSWIEGFAAHSTHNAYFRQWGSPSQFDISLIIIGPQVTV